MKTYEKPRLAAISLLGNEKLCGCDYDAVEPNMDQSIKDLIDIMTAGGFNVVFAEDNCTIGKDNDVILEGYCKFGPTGQLVFNS